MWYQDEHQLWVQMGRNSRPEIETLLSSIAVTDGSTAGAWMRATLKVAIRLARHLFQRLFSVRPAGSIVITSELGGHMRHHG